MKKSDWPRLKTLLVIACTSMIISGVCIFYANFVYDYRIQLQETAKMAKQIEELHSKLKMEEEKINKLVQKSVKIVNYSQKSILGEQNNMKTAKPTSARAKAVDRMKNDILFQSSVPKSEKCIYYHIKVGVDLLNGKCDMYLVENIAWIDGCCEACTVNDGCQGITFVGTKKQCYLKSCRVSATIQPEEVPSFKSYATTAWLKHGE